MGLSCIFPDFLLLLWTLCPNALVNILSLSLKSSQDKIPDGTVSVSSMLLLPVLQVNLISIVLKLEPWSEIWIRWSGSWSIRPFRQLNQPQALFRWPPYPSAFVFMSKTFGVSQPKPLCRVSPSGLPAWCHSSAELCLYLAHVRLLSGVES